MTPDTSVRPAAHRILLVDDEESLRRTLAGYLARKGYETAEAGRRLEAEEKLARGGFDAAVFDYSLPDGNALELLGWLESQDIDLAVVVLTGHATIDLAVQCMKRGADHFLTKPVKIPALEVVIERVIENRRNRRQTALLQSRRTARPLDPFLGQSAAIERLRTIASRVAATASPVRIHGETGTGKGVLSRWLHDNSPRAEEAFVDINCAGLNPDFLESELFGHQKGAFTGAATAKEGLFEIAHRGTVFLDEIGDVDVRVQPKLLKVLEEKRFRRLGEVREREVNVRLIAASHQDLRALIKDGRFREDLYFRISTLPIEIPPLRERREDIRLLAEDILERLSNELGRPAELSAASLDVLEDYAWPGNIRELRNVLERALLLQGSGLLEPRDLHFETVGRRRVAPAAIMAAEPEEGQERLPLQEIERRHIEHILKRCESSIAPAARILGISRTTLYQKIKSHGIEVAAS